MAAERDYKSPLSGREIDEVQHDKQQDGGSGVPLSTISASYHWPQALFLLLTNVFLILV
jgi:hypothetical protein